MLPLATLLAAALHLPVPADAAALPRSVSQVLHIDVATSMAGPLAPATAHLAPGAVGGTEVDLYNVNSRETLAVYLRFDGVTDLATQQTLRHFFRCKRTGRERRMSAGTLGFFAQVAAKYPGHTIEIVSGVRAPGHGVKDSKHYDGHAIDFRVRGVATRTVRDLAWSFDAPLGVGHYKQENFIHLDYRPGEKKIGWDQRRPGAANKYNPRWARAPRAGV